LRMFLCRAAAVALLWCSVIGMPRAGGGAVAAVSREDAPRKLHATIVNRWPHDPGAFTQGLLVHAGWFYESTGLQGRSSLRKVAIETGTVVQQVRLAPVYFGEGLALWGERLIQLTWKAGEALVYDLRGLRRVRRFRYEGEGWGLTDDGRSLIMSNGTDVLVFRDPETFGVQRRVAVRAAGRPVTRLNELEFVKGQVLANVWQTDAVAIIAPDSGVVKAWVDLGFLRRDIALRGRRVDVLNGIAYDRRHDRLFVTGKLWPVVYEIALDSWPAAKVPD